MFKCIFTLCLAVLSCSTLAGSLDAELTNCKKITEDTRRLACFDQIQVPSQKEQQTELASSKSQAVLTEDDFGLEHKTAVKDKLQSRVPMVLKKLTQTPHGLQIFSFENGQIWRQSSKEHFNAKVGHTYILERGALNSFFLSEEGNGRKTRVRRDK
jgi:hypothetical protein